jgi:4-oxalocrotonate tautomerase
LVQNTPSKKVVRSQPGLRSGPGPGIFSLGADDLHADSHGDVAVEGGDERPNREHRRLPRRADGPHLLRPEAVDQLAHRQRRKEGGDPGAGQAETDLGGGQPDDPGEEDRRAGHEGALAGSGHTSSHTFRGQAAVIVVEDVRSCTMPLVNVRVIEGVFTAEQKREMIRRITDTMVEIEGENLRPVTWVVVEEVRSGDWGIGGDGLTTEDVKALQRQPSAVGS